MNSKILENKNIPLDQAISALSRNNAFFLFSLGFSPSDKDLLDSIKIHKFAEYNNFNKPINLSEDIEPFIKDIGDNDLVGSKVALIIANIIDKIIASSKKEAAWISIRASLTNSCFDVPRWHVDGDFFLSSNNEKNLQYKMIVTLKGNPTLFCSPKSEVRKEFNEKLRSCKAPLLPNGSIDKKAWASQRAKLSYVLEKSDVITPNLYQGAVFTVGSEFSAIHSEPPVKVPRLFLSIVPGSASQISELEKRWNKNNT